MADPFLDALGLKDPTAQPSAAAPGKAPAYDPTDLAVRIAMLEDNSPEGRAAVAGVMANRAKAAKGDLLKVLTAPAAFEPWGSSQDKIAAIDPNSDEYKATAAAIVPILQGKAPDPTGGAVNFYGPESNADLAKKDGRPVKPSFDDGSGVRIGGNLFFGGGKPGDTPVGDGGDTFLSTLGVDPGKPLAGVSAGDAADLTSGPATIKVVNGKVIDGATGQPIPDAQAQVLSSLLASGRMKADGTIDGKKVWMQRSPGDAFPEGDFFISAPDKGQKAQASEPKLMGGPQESSLLGGVGQGAADVGLTLTDALTHLPGAEGSGLQNFLHSQQQIYDATHAGDTKSGIGRFAGQVLGSAPVLGAVEIPAAALASRLGPVGEFLAGKGGLELSPSLARLGVRAGSLAAKGAAEGAGAAGLVSSTSDQPLAEQLGEGAIGGALLSPLLHGGLSLGKGALNGARALIEPHTASGPANIAERRIAEVMGLGPSQEPDFTVHVPGSTPTLAEATASAPLAQMQRNLSQNPLTAGVFQAADDANNAARQAVTGEAQGDLNTVADLARVRANAVDAHKAAVIARSAPAEAQPVVSAIDAALASPEANTPQVASALSKAREALVTEPPKDLTPDESKAFHQSALATAGGSGEALTPEAMESARAKLGAKFEDIAGRTNLIADPTLTDGLASVVHDASQVIEEGKIKPLQNLVDQIKSTIQDGQISGASYKALIRRNGPLDLLARSNDGAMRHYAGQIREHLDDALERTMSSDFPGDRIPQSPKPYDPNAAQASAELAGKAAPAPAAAPVLDDTDKALNLIRARREGGGGKGASLADALIKAGGIQDGGAGDLANLGGADYGKRGGLLNRKGGMDLDAAAQWAQERGYIGKPDLSERATPEELLAALRQDLDGKQRVYSQGPTAPDAVRNHADELEEMLHEMGIDPGSMPNGRIKQKMAEYFGTTAPSAETPIASAGGQPAAAAPDLRSPEDLARGKAAVDELRATRLAYKNLKTLEAARRTAGPDGVITPRALYGAVKQNFGSYAYKGGGPLGDVAEAALKAQAEKGPTYQQDPGHMFALRDNLQSQIDKLAKAGETDDASRAAATRLSEVRDAMDQALEKANPDYARFRHIADSTAEPIEAQRYLQGLSLTTNGAKGGTVTLNLVNKALDRIDTARSMPGPHPAKAITQHTLIQLRALQADLEREANRNLGKAKGSETNQLGSAQAELGAMGAPLLVAQHVAGKVPLVGPHVAQAVGRASETANQRVMAALASRLLTPEPLNLPEPGPASRVAQTARRVLATVPGAAGGVLGSRLLGGK